MRDNIIRKRYLLQGEVQGVGFRPFVYRLAHKYNIKGFISNTNVGIKIEAQASLNILDIFMHELQSNLPEMACINKISEETIQTIEDSSFIITQSEKDNVNHSILIGSDMAHCKECKEELFDPSSRHYLYPFINCTNCGPRYSIIHSLPYDRKKTTMAEFTMCEECAKEYNEPLDRRFHAQPTACPKCGVQVWTDDYTNIEAIKICISKLNQGKILAIKGIGGFHLACNALDYNAIEELRKRKNRPHKALAIMVKDIEKAKEYVEIDKDIEDLLTSPRRPIVLCKKIKSSLPANINPDTNTIGIMLPSSPLHELLFHEFENTIRLEALIMTSANTQNKPIAISNEEAMKMLDFIADFYLFHNRDILVRVDDSVLMPKVKEIRQLDTNKTNYISIRRARGFVPKALHFNHDFINTKNILALGADLKSTSCLIKENSAFVSQHIGNLQSLENQAFMLENIKHMQNILSIEAKDIIIDYHPNAHMRSFAEDYTKKHNSTLYKVQHHIAHAYALLADNAIFEPALVLTLDGSGYGLDNTMWGGELFLANPAHAKAKRIGRFNKVLQIAFDNAVKNTWYMTESYIYNSKNPLAKNTDFLNSLPYLDSINIEERENIKELCTQKVGLETSSCGRLFDAIACLCNCAVSISYEGQAAMQLEAKQDNDYEFYEIVDFEDNEISIFNSQQLFNNCLTHFDKLIKQEKDIDIVSRKLSRYFHLSLAHSLALWLMKKADEYNIKKIGLTGGVFLNTTLLSLISNILDTNNYIPLVHQEYSPSDASISLGQAYYTLCKILKINKSIFYL